MLNFLSAISREVGEFRQEMNTRLDNFEAKFVKLEADVKRLKETLSCCVRMHTASDLIMKKPESA